MLGPLNESSDEPLHAQLTRRLRDSILAGRLQSGAPLPSIRELARDARVSVITAQRTLTDLELEGLVEVRRGKGFFVVCFNNADRAQLALDLLRADLVPIVARALNQGLMAPQVEHLVREVLRKQAEAT